MSRKARGTSKNNRPSFVRQERVALAPAPAEIIDLEVACNRCGMPLYVASEQVAIVLCSLQVTGSVWLRCTCGQVQLVGYRQTRCQD